MTHVKNVQAFGKLTGICTGLGGNYNPGKQNLQVNAMTTLLNSAQQIMDEVKEAETARDYAIIARTNGFNGLRSISSRIMGMLRVNGADPLVVKNAQFSTNKIWGRQDKKPAASPTADTETVKKKTLAGPARDYASVLYYFDKMVDTVASEPTYTPNEPALTVDALKQQVAQLKDLNAAVMNAEINLSSARKKRNELYYLGESNLVDTAMASKLYVRNAFGYRSQEHLEVRKLHFTKPSIS